MRTLLITAEINSAHCGNVGTSVKNTAIRKQIHDNLIKYLTINTLITVSNEPDKKNG